MAEGVHPEPKRVWSLGTTILQEQTQKRCVCAFDENGNIYYEAMEVGARENIPPGTPITRTSYSWRVSDGDGGDWLAAARKHAVKWCVERRSWPGDIGQWESPTIFPSTLEWYPRGKFSPPAPDRPHLPRSPGCWSSQFERMEMHKRTCIVSLTFQLELEPYNESWRYRAQADPEFDDSWTIKFNGHERSNAPPDILPPGSLVAVFLAYGKWNERWNPKGKQAEDFVYLKIGSVLDA